MKKEINLIDYGFIVATALSTVALVFSFDDYKPKHYENNRKMQIKSIEDRDNIQGYDTIILGDGREFEIEERNGKLNLLESSLEKIK